MICTAVLRRGNISLLHYLRSHDIARDFTTTATKPMDNKKTKRDRTILLYQTNRNRQPFFQLGFVSIPFLRKTCFIVSFQTEAPLKVLTPLPPPVLRTSIVPFYEGIIASAFPDSLWYYGSAAVSAAAVTLGYFIIVARGLR